MVYSKVPTLEKLFYLAYRNITKKGDKQYGPIPRFHNKYSNFVKNIEMLQNSEVSLKQNLFIHKYIIAINHAFLWIAALSLAGFFHVSPWFEHKEALLFSTLVAYSAYLCESGLGTWRVATSQTQYFINFKKAALWKFVWLNFLINVGWSILFLIFPSWYLILAVIFTAGWQKYMDGRIPPRLEATMIPVADNTFKAIHL